MALEKVGLLAVFERADYRRGVQEYIDLSAKTVKATEKAQRATQKLSFDEATNRWRNASGQFASNAEMVASGVKKAGDAAGAAAAGGLVALAGGALVAVKALMAVVNVALDAAKAVIEFGKASLFTAGRVDELTRVALLLGQQAGFTQEETQGFLDELKDIGIRSDVAAQFISQLARNQLDLAQATDLATVAGNAAVLTGRDTSDTLDDLTRAAVTNQIEVARTAGVNVNFTRAQDELAASLGRTRDQLTEQEKVQANFNAIIAEGAAIQGVYAAASESPTKALRSLGREVFNLQAEVGGPFLSAWKSVIDVARAVVGAFTKMVSEGGTLRPLLINLGAIASIVADAFKNMAVTVINVVSNLRVGVSSEFAMMVENALRWGVEIVAALADGMVQGAAAALTAAMNVIQNLLTSWLAPGSPPRVAPHIDQWGARAFTEYLQGFEQADFGVLKGLQGLMGKFLEKPELQAITLDIGAAVAGGPTTEFFSKLQTAAGEFGTEVVKLAQDYFALSDAIDEAERAQTALDDALKGIAESETAVRDLTGEYNRLLKAGASDEVLAAQLAQINAAEEQLTLAQEQKRQAEVAKAQAEENIGVIEEETKLQEELVNQLLALAAEKEKAEAGAGAGAGAGERAAAGSGAAGAEGIGVGIGTSLGAGVTTGIQTAIEDAKAMLLQKLGKIFEPLRTRWNNSIRPTLEGLMVRFTEFKDFILEKWESLRAGTESVLEILREWMEEKIPDAIDTLKRVIDLTLVPAFKRVWKFIQQFLNPEFSLLSDVILPAITAASAEIAEFWAEKLLPALRDVRDFILDKLMGTLEDFRLRFIVPIADAFKAWKDALEGLEDRLARIWGLVSSILDDIGEIDNPFGDVNPNRTQSDVVPVSPRFSASAAGASAGGNNFNFGNNTITDPMAFAAFEARVIQAVKRELNR